LFLVTISNLSFIYLGMSFIIISLMLYEGKVKIPTENLFIFGVSLLTIVYSCMVFYDGIAPELYLAIFIYMVLSFLLSSVILLFTKDDVEWVIKKIILFFLCLIIMQQIFYLVTGTYLDFYKLLTFGGFESRYFSAFTNQFGLIRPTGINAEPSNFATIITFFIVFLLQVQQRADKFIFLALIATMFTFSFASILIIVLILCVLLINMKFIVTFKGFIVATLITVAISFALFLVYERLFGGVGYDSISARTGVFYFLENRPLYDDFFGSGFLAFKGQYCLKEYCFFGSQIKDIGFWGNLYFSGGIASILFLLIFLHFSVRNVKLLLVVLIALSSKFDFLQPAFWMFLLMVPTANILNKLGKCNE